MLMKKLGKPIAVLSAAALLACTTGCADTSWSFKTKDSTLSNGMYIYYTYVAYNDATSELSKDNNTQSSESKNILSEKIDGKSAEEWIKNKAVEECVAQMTMDKLIKDNKVKVDKEDLKIYEDYAEQWYQYGSSLYQELGISKESYIAATGTYSGLSEQLFASLYDKGGSKEVSKEDKEKYFKENYTNYFYIACNLKTQDDSGNSKDISAEEKEKITTNFAKYKNMLDKQNKTTDDIVAEYKKDFETETDPSRSGAAVIKNLGLNEEVQKTIEGLKEGQSEVKEINNQYYIFYKGKIEDKLSNLDDKSTNTSLLHTMKDEEYNKYIDDAEAKLKYEKNDACLSKYTVQRTVDILKSYSAY